MQTQIIRFADLERGMRISGVVCAWRCEVGRTKHGSPYLKLELRDGDTKLLDGRMWDTDGDSAPDCPAAIYVEAEVDEFRGDKQIIITTMTPTEDDISAFVPTTYRPLQELQDELTGLIKLIRDDDLRALVRTCLEQAPEFWTAPAAIGFHGAYRGGLLEHTLNVTRLCLHAADVYGGRVNLDLLLAAGILHDIGKVDAYDSPESRQPLEHERLLGHVARGVMRVENTARVLEYQGTIPLDDLLHALLSHHGELAYGAPVQPATAEAIILSNADRMEAEVTGCFDHWRDHSGEDSWSYSRQRRGWVRRPSERAAQSDAVNGDGELSDDFIDDLDDLPF